MGITSNYGSAPTYVKIGTITPNGTASDYAFINVPQNYTDLVLVANIRGSKAATTCSLLAYGGTGDDNTSLLQSNENSVVAIVGDGSSVANARTTSATGLQLYSAPAASTTSGIFKQYIINFMGYSDGTGYKSVITRTNGNTETALIIGSVRTTSPLKTVGVATYGDGNIASGSTLTLYGIKAAIVPKATGGDLIRTDGTYWYHTFINSGVFFPNQSLSCDYLVVAGGGAGAPLGGGGGAGGLRSTVTATGGGGTLESPLSLSNTAYIVTVGAGGSRTTPQQGNNGNNSVFGTITSTGGGGGGGSDNGYQTGRTGGSGGGGAFTGSFSGAGGAGTANQGYAGGSGNQYQSTSYNKGGGGGGAGAVGVAANNGTGNAGAGGAGVAVSISGLSVTYAGGGGGGSDNRATGSAGAGGSGGGGAGALGNANATNGTPNTGGGGGSSGYGGIVGLQGNGGSGIVIVRYAV